jgi:PAS domain S-box-containing protein
MSYLGNADPAHFASSQIRVLHVDDQRDLAELTSEFLERKNDDFTVVTETNAQNALDRLASESIDCVVSDYDMPRHDGLEFLEQVRDDHGDIPFILFTGKGSEEIASEAISAGVTDYLQKESGTDQYTVLANRIENAVEHHRSRRAVEATEEKLLQLAERTDDVLFLFDGDWDRLLFINSAYEDLWGGSIAELQDDPTAFLDHIHPDDRERAKRSLERLQHGEPDTIEYRIVTKEGDQRWVRGETKPIFGDHGNVSRIAGFVRDITDQKSREQELRARATAMEAATDGIAILNDDHEYVFVNESHAEIYGYDTPGELLGESWRVCYDDTDVARFESDILPQLAETGEWHGEMTVTAANDETLHQDLMLQRLDDGRTVCVVRDITERKQREQELERYKILTEEVTDGISVVSEDGTIQYENPAFERLLGYDRSTREGTTAFEDMHSEDRQEVIDRFTSLVADDSEKTDRVQYRIRHADGSWRWLESDASGRTHPALDGCVITSRDITERKERERELEEVTSQYATLIEHFPNGGVFLFNENLRIVRAGGTELRKVGLSRDGVEGTTPHDRYPDEIADEHAYYFEKTLAGEEHRYQQSYQGEDYEILTVPIRDDAGEVIYGMAVSRNITQQVEQRRKLERQNERLEEFAAVVSHDLRNPLRVAEGRVELLREECDSEHLDAIETALQRSDRIIEDVLWLTREGRDMGSTDTVALREAVDDAWKLVADDMEQAELHYGTGDQSLSPIVADADRLRQLLENLFRNALEHGGGDVTVTVGPFADGFYVEDTGPGIPESERDDVFVPGYSTSDEGTGFGLAIVKRVVDAHGWEIDVTESSVGGARFEITSVEFPE